MIPRWLGKGRGIGGLVSYITHDAVPAGSSTPPSTAERVAWIETINSPTDDPSLTAVVMRGLKRDAEMLKALSGVSMRGRKTKAAYWHLALSWERGALPSREHAMDTVRMALSAIRADKLIAVASGHEDTDHFHVHVAGCSIDPETGRTWKDSMVPQRLQRMALNYERQHGIRVPLRARLAEAREELAKAEEHTVEHDEAYQHLVALMAQRHQGSAKDKAEATRRRAQRPAGRRRRPLQRSQPGR